MQSTQPPHTPFPFITWVVVQRWNFLKSCFSVFIVCFCSCLHYVKGGKPAGRIEKRQREGKKPLHVSNQELCAAFVLWFKRLQKHLFAFISSATFWHLWGSPLFMHRDWSWSVFVQSTVTSDCHCKGHQGWKGSRENRAEEQRALIPRLA